MRTGALLLIVLIGVGRANAQEAVSKGMPPRASAADYQAHAQAGKVTIAAEFTGHGVPTPQLVLSTEDFIGVELGLFGPAGDDCVALVSLTIEGYDPQEVAAVLDSSFRIQVRPGLHCAPLMHRALGTLDRGGTVRLSLGHFTTTEEIDAVVAALSEMTAS